MMMRAEGVMSKDMAMEASLPLPSGEQEVSSQVTLTYEVR